jgi:hypothetical protein
VGVTKLKGLRIATRCRSLDEFVAAFHRNVDEESFFIATHDVRPVGLETAFAIELSDKTPVLRGTCIVLQVWTTGANPFKHPGLLCGIRKLTASSVEVFERLLITRTPPRPPSITEERTPGSDLVLPANPIADLSDAALAGYVDCTLYEETGSYFAPDPEPSGALELDDPPTPIPPPEPPTMTSEIVVPPEPAFELELRPPPPPRPVHADDSPPAVEVGALPLPTAPRPRWRHPAVLAGGAVGVIATSMIVFAASSRHGNSAAPEPAKVASAAPALPPSPPPPPAPVPAAAKVAPSCTLALAIKPADSSVQLDGHPVGGTSATTTCERHRIDIVHPRYEPKTQWVTLEPDQPGSVAVQLARPTHQVVVNSTPPSATIFVDGHRVGVAPVMTSVPGYEPVTVRAEKPGYRAASQRLYSKAPHDQVSIRLVH